MLKTIAIFSTDIEAELIKGKLESSGIESFIFKDDCGGMRPHMQLTDGVQLKVADADFETAKDILTIESDEEQPVQTEETDSTKSISQLLHRARGWILVGFAIIPGWISFPISFIYSIMASKRYNESGIKDDGLKNQILRIQIASAFFTILFWSAAIYYISI
jgi:hypothetical protein